MVLGLGAILDIFLDRMLGLCTVLEVLLDMVLCPAGVLESSLDMVPGLGADLLMFPILETVLEMSLNYDTVL